MLTNPQKQMHMFQTKCHAPEFLSANFTERSPHFLTSVSNVSDTAIGQ